MIYQLAPKLMHSPPSSFTFSSLTSSKAKMCCLLYCKDIQRIFPIYYKLKKKTTVHTGVVWRDKLYYQTHTICIKNLKNLKFENITY